MVNSCRLYYNTGFKVGDIPDKVSLLNSASYMDVDGHWDLQDFFVSELRLKITWNNIENADYIKFGDAYYWITGKNMVNQNMCIISLQLDALTSMGGATELSYIAGRINRAHPSASDEENLNTLPEAITPQHPLVASTMNVQWGNINALYPIMASTVDLLNTDITYADGQFTGGKSMSLPSDVVDSETGDPIPIIIPQAPKLSNPTTYTLEVDDTTSIVGSSGGYGLYWVYPNATTGLIKTVKDNIAYVIALGLTGSLLFTYYPKILSVGQLDGSSGHIQNLNGGHRKYTLSLSLDGYTPRYNKTAHMYRSVQLMGALNGNARELDTHDICTGTQFSLILTSDPQPDGKLYLRTERFQNKLTKTINEFGVSGTSWVKQPVASNTSGLLLADNQYGLAVQSYITKDVNFQEQMALNKSSNRMNGITSALGSSFINNSAGMQSSGPGTNGEYAQGYQASVGGFNPLAPIGGMLGGIHNEFTVQPAQQRMHDNAMAIDKLNIKYDKAMARIQTPNLSCTPASGLSIYRQVNDFAVYEIGPSKIDMQRIDDYFDQYGYSMDIKFDKSYMSNRQNFNYLATEDVRIARTHGSLMLREIAENQLNNGVRIWHTLPNNN